MRWAQRVSQVSACLRCHPCRADDMLERKVCVMPRFNLLPRRNGSTLCQLPSGGRVGSGAVWFAWSPRFNAQLSSVKVERISFLLHFSFIPILKERKNILLFYFSKDFACFNQEILNPSKPVRFPVKLIILSDFRKSSLKYFKVKYK